MQFLARPPASEAKDVGGAYVSCWIKAESPEAAQKSAETSLKEDGWLVEGVEEPVTTGDKPTDDKKEYFEQAQAEGECYVFYTWSAEDKEDQVAH